MAKVLVTYSRQMPYGRGTAEKEVDLDIWLDPLVPQWMEKQVEFICQMVRRALVKMVEKGLLSVEEVIEITGEENIKPWPEE